MKIEVQSDKKYSQYDQFDPFQLKELKLFHDECHGGAVKLHKDESRGVFECTACGETEIENVVECRAALRRVLIRQATQNVGHIWFSSGGPDSKKQSSN